MKLRDKIVRFMYGRNGIDLCNEIIFILYLIAIVVSIATDNLLIDYVSVGFSIVLALFFIYRAFSKDLPQRQAENEVFLRIKRSFFKSIRLTKDKWRDRKTHYYKKCPKCKNVLRLKRIKGKHSLICPKCHEKITVNIKVAYANPEDNRIKAAHKAAEKAQKKADKERLKAQKKADKEAQRLNHKA